MESDTAATAVRAGAGARDGVRVRDATGIRSRPADAGSTAGTPPC